MQKQKFANNSRRVRDISWVTPGAKHSWPRTYVRVTSTLRSRLRGFLQARGRFYTTVFTPSSKTEHGRSLPPLRKKNMAEECSVSNTFIAISSFSSTATTYEQLYDNLCTYWPTCEFTNRLFNGFGQSLCACEATYLASCANTYIRSSQTLIRVQLMQRKLATLALRTYRQSLACNSQSFFAVYRSWKT